MQNPNTQKYRQKIHTRGTFLPLLCFVLLCFVNSCARSPSDLGEKEIVYHNSPPVTVNKSHTPLFLIKNPEQRYNRIGMPSARESTDKDPLIYVDPDKPALFYEKQHFTTAKGSYQNLIYRIHFQKVPFGLTKLNLTAGKNSGLLLIYTLDETGNLILVTTVHSCGCYLAFFPTDSMDRSLFPENWPKESEPQWVYGYSLPSLLQFSKLPQLKLRQTPQILFTLEDETHRIGDLTLSTLKTLSTSCDTRQIDIFPMATLYHLPYKDRTESFFEEAGPRAGYVRNNTKWLERLFISWWAFDFHVGEDKAYGADDTSETIFYTSLKFWDRKDSDLKNFPRFLSYWGWKL